MKISSRSLAGRHGFTLLEVLVAMAIIAIALGALLKTSAGQAREAVYLRDKTYAHWVALNKIAEFQLAADWPGTGESQGAMELGDSEWIWRAKISATPEAAIRRLDIEVIARLDRRTTLKGADFSAPLDAVVAFLPKP